MAKRPKKNGHLTPEEFAESLTPGPAEYREQGHGPLRVTTMRGAGIVTISDFAGNHVSLSFGEIDHLILMLMKAHQDLERGGDK